MTDIIPAIAGDVYLTAERRNGANRWRARNAEGRDITDGARITNSAQITDGARREIPADGKPKRAVVVGALRNVAPGAVCDLRAVGDFALFVISRPSGLAPFSGSRLQVSRQPRPL
jgi:hypothetical protein